MEPGITIALIGIASLIIERCFSWSLKIKKSKCCGNVVEMKDDCNNKNQ